MVIVTHEMEFARGISSRVFYLDEGVIYEEGAPDQIFDHPQRDKTRAFLHRIRRLHRQITSPDYDLYGLQAEMETFCEKHALTKKITERVVLMAEELLRLQQDFSDLQVGLSYSEKDGGVELECRSAGAPWNPLEAGREEDELGIRLIRGLCSHVEYHYQDEKNVLSLQIEKGKGT